MATPSINIGIGNNGKKLSESIDFHFKTHEFDLYDSIVSAGVVIIDDAYSFEHYTEDAICSSDSESLFSWFDEVLYPEINNLRELADGNVDNWTHINILIQIEEVQSIEILKDLLTAIQDLRNRESVGELNVQLFAIIHPLHSKSGNNQSVISEKLMILKQINQEFNELLSTIYYIDNQNIDSIHLGLDTKWLGFALAEFNVLQMVGPKSMARTSKDKILGIGIVHFNEVLFRDTIRDKILEYKFIEERVDDEFGIQLQEIYDNCNPFISKHQDFFRSFMNKYPDSKENQGLLEENIVQYISDFKNNLDGFVSNTKNSIGESKAILANLIGEDDEILEGVDWKGERLNFKDLEFDIISYFNDFLADSDKVDLTGEKYLREQITDLKNSIKKGYKSIKKIDETSDEIHKDLDISFDEGVFSIDGKRINASGYIPSPIDPSVDIYSYEDSPISKNVDLSIYFPPVKDQGQLGSCTAFSVAAIYEFAAHRNNKKAAISELFIYYNARVLNGNTDIDSGASLLDAINGVKELGACYSESHPYIIDDFTLEPSQYAFDQAKQQIVEKAYRVEIKEKDIKHAIAAGHPVVFGLKLFESFYPQNNSGIIQYPSSEEKTLDKHGRHAMLIVGFNDDEKLFKVRNSWGSQFGDAGYCYIPYDYIANTEFCDEAYVITKIVDISFLEFESDTTASFSFLNDRLVRRKAILSYEIRAKKKLLLELQNEHKEIAFHNEENIEQIKDSIFRKQLQRELSGTNHEEKSASKFNEVNSQTEAHTELAVSNEGSRTKLFYLLASSIIIFIVSVSAAFSIPWISILGAVVGSIVLLWSISKMNKTKEKLVVKKSISNSDGTKTTTKNLYDFMVADRLFDAMEKLEADLITRYRAMSKYYSLVKNWKVSNTSSLETIDYSSPNFVFNVIEQKPLMDYIESQKNIFLKELPNLSYVFHTKYDPKLDNTQAVFSELEANYKDDIQKNIDKILDISITEYLLGKKYPYFNNAPDLTNLMPKLEKVSKPFCNLKSTATNIHSQHYILLENIKNEKNNSLEVFSRHRNPNITPVIVERDTNRKKYVCIQIADLEGVDHVVRSRK